MDRVGLHDGWMADPRMVRPPRKNLDTCKIKEIEPQMDVVLHPETLGHVMGYVGPL